MFARAFTFAPRSISSFIFAASGAAIISSVVPALVAAFASSPPSNSRFNSPASPKSAFSAHGSRPAGSPSFNSGISIFLPGPSAYASAITAQSAAIAERN